MIVFKSLNSGECYGFATCCEPVESLSVHHHDNNICVLFLTTNS